MAENSVKKSIILATLLCAAGLVVWAGCDGTEKAQPQKPGFEIDQVQERGPLTVHVRVDRNKMTIAETLLLELEATIEPQYEVQIPKVNEVLENYRDCIQDWMPHFRSIMDAIQ